ncbi:MAG: THUMP-like domain-containing protein [Aquaticitalea sp.]
MNNNLLNTESQIFITSNLNADITTLLFKGKTFEGVSTRELIEQIEAKKRSEKKLPTWFAHKNIYYPNKLNIEQTSSEITASYKASLITGKSIIDLTGGFGVDSFYFSKRFESVTHCEIDTNVSQIAQHNFKQLKVGSIENIASDGLEFLKASNRFYDWIYVDPSRRHDVKGKVFFLKDCLPNIPDQLDVIFEYSNNVMIKTSPLLDISAGIDELKYVKTIHVVAVNNEVKELLWILEKEYDSEVSIETINLNSKKNEVFKFNYSVESMTENEYILPLTYLYEPNSAILKAGGFNSVASKLKVHKLHKHSHLYSSDTLIDFPGRSFEIQKVIPYNKKDMKRLNFQKANITTRNFPETVEHIRKKFNIKDGGSTYLFFTTNLNNDKIVLECSKIN